MEQGSIYVESLSSGKGEWFDLPVSKEICIDVNKVDTKRADT